MLRHAGLGDRRRRRRRAGVARAASRSCGLATPGRGARRIVTEAEHTEIDERRGRALGPGRRADAPGGALDEIWTPMHLERLARTYWRFLTRCTLGLVRVALHRGRALRRAADAPVRAAALPARPSTRWTRRAASCAGGSSAACSSPRPGATATATCEIDVRAPARRRRRAAVTSPSRSRSRTSTRRSRSRLGRLVYTHTQSRIHVIVTHGFLRSLARLDLAESRVGPLRARRPRRASARSLAVAPPVISRSLARSCRAWMRRTVPERERMTSDSVVARRGRS